MWQGTGDYGFGFKLQSLFTITGLLCSHAYLILSQFYFFFLSIQQFTLIYGNLLKTTRLQVSVATELLGEFMMRSVETSEEPILVQAETVIATELHFNRKNVTLSPVNQGRSALHDSPHQPLLLRLEYPLIISLECTIAHYPACRSHTTFRNTENTSHRDQCVGISTTSCMVDSDL